MATYFCKDCNHNNNGWCKKHKKQGLKDVERCKDRSLTIESIPEVEEEINVSEVQYLIGEIENLLDTLKNALNLK